MSREEIQEAIQKEYKLSRQQVKENILKDVEKTINDIQQMLLSACVDDCEGCPYVHLCC